VISFVHVLNYKKNEAEGLITPCVPPVKLFGKKEGQGGCPYDFKFIVVSVLIG
jgi:hypothetical protein